MVEAKMFIVVLLTLFAQAINGQSDSCNTSRINFLNDFPECLEAFEEAAYNVSLGYGVGNAAIDLVCADTSCRMAIASYANSCITDMDQAVKAQHQLYTFGCILLTEGEACFSRVSELDSGFAALFNLTTTCGSEYLMGTCSDYCVQSIITLVDELDCCYSEAVRSISLMASDQTKSIVATFTRDYFLLCGLEVPTFCQNGTIPPPPTECSIAVLELFKNRDKCASFARQILTEGDEVTSNNLAGAICLVHLLKFSHSCDIKISVSAKCQRAATGLFASNDSCAQAFTTIPDNTDDRVSFEQADYALDAVCGTTGCKSRVIDFADSCLSEVDRKQYEVFVLQFGCRTNVNGSCFAVQQSGALDAIATAFDLRKGGICVAAAISTQCRPNCVSVIEEAVNENHCCVYEFAQAALDSLGDLANGISIDRVFSTCGVTNPGRCPEQSEGTFRYAAIDADDDDNNDNIYDDDDNNVDGGGASPIVGYAMLISLLALLPILTA